MYVRIIELDSYSENCARVLGLWVGEVVSLFILGGGEGEFHYRIGNTEWNVPEDDILQESGLA